MIPQDTDKNSGNRQAARDKQAAPAKSASPDTAPARTSGGYKKNRKPSGGGPQPERYTRNTPYNQPPKGVAPVVPKSAKQGKPQGQPATDGQTARNAVKARQKDGEYHDAAAVRGAGHTPQKTPEVKNRQPQERGARDRDAQTGRDQAVKGKAAGAAGANTAATNAAATNTGASASGASAANAAATHASAGASAGGSAGAANARPHAAPHGAGQSPQRGAAHGAPQSGASHGAASGTAHGTTHGKSGSAAYPASQNTPHAATHSAYGSGGGRGRHSQSAHALRIKAEETLEDIKTDIVRIEKEIDLEIKEIQSLKLVL